MTLIGHVKDNIITIDNKDVNLPDGSLVKIIPVSNEEEIDDICGSWEDDRSAEEIINDIRQSRRNSNRDISL